MTVQLWAVVIAIKLQAQSNLEIDYSLERFLFMSYSLKISGNFFVNNELLRWQQANYFFEESKQKTASMNNTDRMKITNTEQDFLNRYNCIILFHNLVNTTFTTDNKLSLDTQRCHYHRCQLVLFVQSIKSQDQVYI